MLIDYIRNTTERLISSREQKGILPAACTLNDLMREAREDITECMRQLAREGAFRAAVNINKLPMLIRPDNETRRNTPE